MRDFELSKERGREFLREAENHRLAQIARGGQRSGSFVGVRQLPGRLWAMRWRVTPVMIQVQRSVDLHNHKTEELPALPHFSR